MSPVGAMRKSVESSHFAMVPRSDVPRSAFDVQHMHKTSFDSMYLVPVLVDEVLPGDTLQLNMHAFARLATPLVPIMDNLYLESFFFFVPCRLVWDNWQRFMGEMSAPTDTTEFLVPSITVNPTFVGPATLADYMGITTNAAGSHPVNVLPFRAYNLIWNEFFRDQDLQVKVPQNTGDGPDNVADYTLLKRNKRPDYFTTARPWPFKPLPNTAVFGSFDPLGYGGNYLRPAAGAPITGIGIDAAGTPTGAAGNLKESGGRVSSYAEAFNSVTGPAWYMRGSPAGGGAGTYPDLRVLISDLRIANTVQQYLEKAARGGSRYTEIMRSLFGVVSPDARLQRPEYLGGGRTMIQIHPVTQTAPTGVAGTTTRMGEQAGQAQASVYNHGFKQSFTEHGYIIGMINVRADLTYQQGIQRMWNRTTMYDFYSPPFAHLGEQAILRRELYVNGVNADDRVIWGYQERWAEYKWKPSRTSGHMRSTSSTPLDMWHLGEKYTAAPVMNANWLDAGPPIGRVSSVSALNGSQFIIDSLFEQRWVRAMPMYSIPGLGGRL